MPGRRLRNNDGVSVTDCEAVEAARKAGCELGVSRPKSPVAEAVPPTGP